MLVPQTRKAVVGKVVVMLASMLCRVGIFLQLGCFLVSALQGAVTQDAALRFALGVLPLLVMSLIFDCLSRWCAARAAAEVKSKVSSLVFDKVVRLGSERARVVSDDNVSQLMGEGIELLKPYVSAYMPQLFYAVLAPVVLFAITLTVNLPTALVLLVCVPLMPASIMLLMKKAKKFMGDYWGSYTDLGAQFADSVRGLVTLKVFGSDSLEQKHLDESAEEFRTVTMRLLKAQLGSVAFMDLFTYGGIAAGVIVAAWQISCGALAPGSALPLVFIIQGYFTPMRKFGSMFHTGMNASPVIEQVVELLGAEETGRGSQAPALGYIDIKAAGLGFAYAQGSSVLRDVDFHMIPNSYLGIVGPSGSGKSTLASILAGDLSGYTGSIKVNGAELCDLDKGAWHEAVTIVGRESHVFAGTFRSNLQLAKPGATDPQLWYALRRVKLDDFVLSQGGLDAPVYESGTNLSGGQCQRLCIARALLRDTPLYIFDEPTSNIDAQSEGQILSVIQEVALRKSVVMVTHRLKTLVYADEILVMDGGELAQRGAHHELLAQCGMYRDLWEQNWQLEFFAEQIQGLAPNEEGSSELDEALAAMPGMMSNVMSAFVEIIDAEKYNMAPQSELPLGHPSWIPLPNYRPGMSKKPSEAEPCIEGETAGQSENPDAVDDKALSGFAGATADGMSGMNVEAIEEAMRVVREHVKPKSVGELPIEPEPNPSRSIASIAAGLLKLTFRRIPEMIVAVLLGFVGWLASVGTLVFAAAALAAMMGVPSAQSIPMPGCFVGMIACALLRGPLHYAERLATHDQTFKTLALIRSECFKKLRELAPARLDGEGSSGFIALLTSDVELLEGFYSRACTPALTTLLAVVAGVAVSALASRQLGLLMLLASLVCGVLLPLVSVCLTRGRGAEMRAYAVKMGGFLLDSLQGLSDLLHLGRGGEYAAELEERMGSLDGASGAFARLTSLLGSLPRWTALVFLCAIPTCFIGEAVDASPIALLIACAAFYAGADSVVAFAESGASLHQVFAAADRVLDVLAEEPTQEDVDPDGAWAAEAVFESLEARDLGFARGNKQIFSDVSFSIKAGEFVGLTGKSGVGKSTLLKLIMRFWQPSCGELKMNGEALDSLPLSRLRATQSYMTQGTYLFEGTLGRNLLVAKPDATKNELASALKKAGINALAGERPLALDTVIEGEGASISSGQRQRVGLARAFLHNAPLMLLDEPTSNLDSMNEALVLKSLCENAESKTVVVVSHRKTVLAIVDKLLLLEEERDS